MEEPCLICKSKAITHTLGNSSSSLLSKELDAYFILKHVLDLSDSQLGDYMRDGESLDKLFTICENCMDSYVKKCVQIWEELAEVKRKFLVAKLEAIEAIKRSLEEETDTETVLQTDDPKRQHNTGNFCKRIRRLVNEREYGDVLVNPFTSGDSLAEQRARKLKSTYRSNLFVKKANTAVIKDTTSAHSDDEDYRRNSPLNFPSGNSDHDDDDNWDADNPSDESSEEEKVPRASRKSLKTRSTLVNKYYAPKPKAPLNCNHCSKTFRTLPLLKRHKVHIHKSNLHECSKCDYSAGYRCYLDAHIKRHHGDPKDLQELTCPTCQKVLSSQKKLKLHIHHVHNKDQRLKFVCEHCPKEFYQKASLLGHLGSEHSDIHRFEYACPFDGCSKSFPKRSQLTLHEDQHKKGTQYKCDLCDRFFVSKYSLRNHQTQTHENESKRSFKCDLCPASYTTNQILSKHKRKYHDAGQSAQDKKIYRGYGGYKCSECEAEFASQGKIKMHMERAHGKEYVKPTSFSCEICGAVYKDKDVLKRHIHRVHEKAYYGGCCEVCGRIFTRKLALKFHKKRAHDIGDFELPNFPCTVEGCDRSFGNKTDMETHVRFRHEGRRDFMCEWCGKHLITQSELNRHLRQVHGIKLNTKIKRDLGPQTENTQEQEQQNEQEVVVNEDDSKFFASLIC